MSAHVAKVGEDSFWLRGDLTIHGVTREVTLRGRFDAPVVDLAAEPVVHFDLTAEVNREDYGMHWPPPSEIGALIVGKNVTITISAEVHRRDDGAA